MNRSEQFLNRLDNIGRSLEKTGQALALLGLGSVGAELDRLDDHSDLDFFVIARDGCKTRFIQYLDWLEDICPVAYTFQNTADGHKSLLADGIFCEWAVFETAELARIPFAGGRIVWQAEEFDASMAVPAANADGKQPRPVEWLLGEALTNLYVGLSRYHRGEKLSAVRFIQGYAVDRLLELAALIENEQPAHRDPFAAERRYEQRFPQMAQALPQFIQGYDRTVESAQAILAFLDRHFQVNAAMKAQILTLSEGSPARNQLSIQELPMSRAHHGE